MPSIERYLAAIDPRREPAAACSAVLAAFDAAVTWTDVLAEAWRARYPAWSDAIDAAVGVSSLDLDPQEFEALGQRIGPVAFDGHGRYELLERIGRGASGRVFRAVDHVFMPCGEPAEVAVKLISCAEDEIAGALREAGHARRISHSGVARVLDAGLVDPAVARELGCGDPAIFIVQEFVHGQPLWIWRACHPERAASTCDLMMANIREALDACHERGISHGDLNPANVLVEPGGRTRIIDFGRSFRGHEVGTLASRRHDDERLDAIRGWLLRDLRRTGGGARSGAAYAAAATMLGVLIVARHFLSTPSPMTAITDARRPEKSPAVEAAVPDASIGPYELVKQQGRAIPVPKGPPQAGNPEPVNGIKLGLSMKSIAAPEAGLVWVKIAERGFRELVGDATGESDRTVPMPSGYMENPEAIALLPLLKGERPQDRVSREDSSPSPESRNRDAFIAAAFGEFPGEPRSLWRMALAHSLLLDGPVAAENRGLWIALAIRIKEDAEAQRQAGQDHSGLELLAAMAFLSADVNLEALALALRATSPTMRREQRDLAEIIRAIATARMGTCSGGVAQSEIEEFARRHAAPGLMRYLLDP